MIRIVSELASQSPGLPVRRRDRKPAKTRGIIPPATLILLAMFTAPVVRAQPLALHQKADLFQKDMEDRFLLEGQALCKLKNPATEQGPAEYNMPDNAYMTGIYTGTLAMKFAVTGDADDLRAARNSLKALFLLCNVSGTAGVLARAAWPRERPLNDDGIWRDSPCGRYRWRGEVSTDQVDGVMFGFALAYDLFADDEEKMKIARDVTAIVERVVENDMQIVDVDGKPTRWGRYGPRYVTRGERMNALLWLQALKVAEHVTQDKARTELYRKWAVDEKYAELAVKARRMASPLLPGLVNHSDDVLIFLAYVPLLTYEKDASLRELYVASLRRSWEGDGRFPGVQPEQNPFYGFVAAKFLEDAACLGGVVDTLKWFPPGLKWNRPTITKYESLYGFRYDPGPLSPAPAPGHPIPVDRRTKTWSAWVQDPYHNGKDNEGDSMEYNGHDYLLGYWMGRFYGYVESGA